MNDAAVLVRRTPAEHLLREARRVLARTDSRAGGPYVRVEVDAGDADPLAWLAAQSASPRIYWHGRGSGEAVACAGQALSVADDAGALGAWFDRLGPEARFYGGFRFDAHRPLEAGAWRSDERFRLTLPRVTLTRHAGGTGALALHLVLPRDLPRRGDILRLVRTLAEPAHLARALPLPHARHDLPGFDGWRANVEAALADFREGRLDKVVLARRVTFAFAEALDPFALLSRLEAATPTTFHFLTEHAPGAGSAPGVNGTPAALGARASAAPTRAPAAFVGASPERLFRQDGRCVWTEAVAGTRPRGASRGEDAALADELMGSEKDAREHGYVRSFLASRLAPLATELRVDDAPEALEAARVRHLRTRIEATLRTGVRPLDVLAALHPTPAVGGTPTPEALAFLRAREPFDRGRYAAPVGWMSQDAAEFAVGIRAGRVEGRALALYSGAGIVDGSDALREWHEIEAKIGDFAAALGLDARR